MQSSALFPFQRLTIKRVMDVPVVHSWVNSDNLGEVKNLMYYEVFVANKREHAEYRS